MYEKARLMLRPSSEGAGTVGGPLSNESEHSVIAEVPRGWHIGFQTAFEQAAIGMALLDIDGR